MPEYGEVRKAAVAAGWRVEKTKKGEVLKAPDGVHSATWDFTPSDWRAMKNLLRDLRAGGFKFEPDKARRKRLEREAREQEGEK